MTPLSQLLDSYRNAAVTEREKGTYFEELIVCYLRNEATYRDLYCDVWTYAEWADLQNLDKRDAGIDLVTKTRERQCVKIDKDSGIVNDANDWRAGPEKLNSRLSENPCYF